MQYIAYSGRGYVEVKSDTVARAVLPEHMEPPVCCETLILGEGAGEDISIQPQLHLKGLVYQMECLTKGG
jgi:hypothetical protein